MKQSAAHPYNLACSQCGGTVQHRVVRHHSGERMFQCKGCGTYRALKRYKRNPIGRQLQSAVRLYENFSGEAGEAIARVPAPKVPKVALAIGPVLMIGYETVRDGTRERYVHRFAAHARPLLVASHDGRSVFLLGGAYTFTDRGIVDKGKSR